MPVKNVDEVNITSDNLSSSLRIMPCIIWKDKIKRKQSSISGAKVDSIQDSWRTWELRNYKVRSDVRHIPTILYR